MKPAYGWLYTLATLMLAGCAVNAPAGPAPSGAEPVTTWLVDQGGSTPGKIMYMRNNTDAPVTITSVTLYECENVRNPCQTQRLEARLEPGETREIQRVEAQQREQAFQFRYRFGWDAVEQETSPRR